MNFNWAAIAIAATIGGAVGGAATHAWDRHDNIAPLGKIEQRVDRLEKFDLAARVDHLERNDMASQNLLDRITQEIGTLKSRH